MINTRHLFASILFLAIALGFSQSLFSAQFPQNPTFSTLVATEFSVEGLTADATGNLYTAGRTVTNNTSCPVYRVTPAAGAGSLAVVGFIPDPDGAGAGLCGPTGLAFNDAGSLFAADGAAGIVYSLIPDPATQPVATVFASGVPGTNGLAFDRNDNLWTGDGTTGQGRVWKISPSGVVEEIFRIQPMANEVNLVSGVGGVGRDVRALPPGTITVTPTSRNAANTLGSQPLVANGSAFTQRKGTGKGKEGGELYIADTARGAIWRVELKSDGSLGSRTGCDTTFTPNTLCLENIHVAHPVLEGADGIALDRAGNIWVSVNERNAIAVVTVDKTVIEIFRNDTDSGTQLRNTGPLEFPTSPFLVTKLFCTANSDGDRRDNSPNAAGEVKPAGPTRGKISCMDQELSIPGLPLPIH
jgi:sugar lactone lactonase YvrE